MQTNISKSIKPDAIENTLSKLKFSFNSNSIYSQSSNEQLSLIEIYSRIKTPSVSKRTLTTKIRNNASNLFEGFLCSKDKDRLSNEIKNDKQSIGYYLNGSKNAGTGAKDDYNFNGCIFFDLDFRHAGGHKRALAFKNILKGFDFVALSHISTTAYGLKGIFYTDLPSDCTPSQYTFAEKQIFDFIASKGVYIDYDKHGLGKTCYYSFDSDPYLNLKAKPFHVDFTQYSEVVYNPTTATATANSTDVQGAIEYLINNKIDIGAVCYDDYMIFSFACISAFDADGEGYAFEVLSNSQAFLMSSTGKNFKASFKNFLKSHKGTGVTGQYIIDKAVDNGFIYKKPIIRQITAIQDYSQQPNDLLIINRNNALELIKKDSTQKTVVCEKTYIDSIKNSLKGEKVTVITYSDISNISDKTVYVFGSQNLNRRQNLNTLNTTGRIAASCNITFFADTHTRLPIANRYITIDNPTLTSKIITSEKPQSTFVELVRNDSNALYLDTAESIKTQLTGVEMVKRSELYAADKSKNLYVLFDNHCGMLPENFAGFNKVFFIVNSEVKPCISIQNFTYFNEKGIYNFLESVENDLFVTDIEKGFDEVIKGKKLAVRKTADKWERCNNTACVLEYEHELKLLVSDSENLSTYLQPYSLKIDAETAILSDNSAIIENDIKESKKDLKEQKRAEFIEFVELVEAAIDNGLNALNSFDYDSLSRGAKVACNRIKALLKVNDSISMCVEAVKNSYSTWSRTKGLFYTAKVAQGKSCKAAKLQTFRDTTQDNFYEKSELIELANSLDLVTGDDKMKWNQLKRICVINSKVVKINKRTERRYETHFL